MGSKDEPYPPGTGGCGAEIAMDVEELFGAGVVGLQIGVGNGPRRRYPAFMLNDAEVFGSHAKQCSAVDLCLPPNEIRLLRVQVPAFLILPSLFGVITVIEKDGGGVPVELLLRQEGATLDDKDFLPARARWKARVPPPAPVPIMIVSYSSGKYDSDANGAISS